MGRCSGGAAASYVHSGRMERCGPGTLQSAGSAEGCGGLLRGWVCLTGRGEEAGVTAATATATAHPRHSLRPTQEQNSLNTGTMQPTRVLCKEPDTQTHPRICAGSAEPQTNPKRAHSNRTTYRCPSGAAVPPGIALVTHQQHHPPQPHRGRRSRGIPGRACSPQGAADPHPSPKTSAACTPQF